MAREPERGRSWPVPDDGVHSRALYAQISSVFEGRTGPQVQGGILIGKAAGGCLIVAWSV